MLVATSSARTPAALTRAAHPAGAFSHNLYVMATLPTEWGLCGIVWKTHESETRPDFTTTPDQALLCRLHTPRLSLGLLRQDIRQHYPDCGEVFPNDHGSFHPDTVPNWFHQLARFLQDYYRASLRRWTQPQFTDHWAFWQPRLDWSQLTAFQRRVLEIVAAIPSGSSMTYGQVARAIGQPAASRAVGAAIGRNPWPVLIPCHRVLGSSGHLTGFSAPGGIHTKRRMLEMEAL
jgi:O-6-methylguanine DNA methyltransferase